MLLCASEASRFPSSPHEAHCLIPTPLASAAYTWFVHAACQVRGVAWPGVPGQHFPTSTVSLSFSVSCIGWFHPTVGFAPVVIYPLTRMSHGAGFYMFQEKIAEGICVLWCWEPRWGPEPGKEGALGAPWRGFHRDQA